VAQRRSHHLAIAAAAQARAVAHPHRGPERAEDQIAGRIDDMRRMAQVRELVGRLPAAQERFEAVGRYDQESLEGSVTVVGTTERDPAEVCRELWADGVVAGSDARVPDDLTACVMPTDAVELAFKL
jgi:hypothetical protein